MRCALRIVNDLMRTVYVTDRPISQASCLWHVFRLGQVVVNLAWRFEWETSKQSSDTEWVRISIGANSFGP